MPFVQRTPRKPTDSEASADAGISTAAGGSLNSESAENSSHQQQAFSRTRQETVNKVSDDDDGVKRADGADEVQQALSNQLSFTNSHSDRFVIIDRDVSSEDGETTDCDSTSMVDSESDSHENEDSDDSPDSSNIPDNHNGHDNQDNDEEAFEDSCDWLEVSEEDRFEDEADEGDEANENMQNEERIGADMHKMFYHGFVRVLKGLGPR